jgi:mannose-6-phosphate isomerase-like protein (cupin superfamily)
MSVTAFDPLTTYAFLHGSAADVMPGGMPFWENMPASVEYGEGWLVGAYEMKQDTSTWEMHPEGDELLVLLSGALDIVLDEAAGQRTVALETGQTCLVPRGTWHRQIVRRPAVELGLTYGRSTQHRPI